MYVIRKMRLNKFEPTPISSPRALFARKGEQPAPVESKLTQDCIADAMPGNPSKLQALALGDEIAKKAYQFAKDPDHIEPLDRVDPNDL